VAGGPAKLPSEVLVGPYRYEIIDDLIALHHASVRERDPLDGYCSPRRQQILVDTQKSHPGSSRYTLLHEILHALTDLSGHSKEWGDDDEEAFVTRFTPLLLDVLRRNPKLVDYLLAEV
jgi:hypothetical protein